MVEKASGWAAGNSCGWTRSQLDSIGYWSGQCASRRFRPASRTTVGHIALEDPSCKCYKPHFAPVLGLEESCFGRLCMRLIKASAPGLAMSKVSALGLFPLGQALALKLRSHLWACRSAKEGLMKQIETDFDKAKPSAALSIFGGSRASAKG